MLLLDTNVLAKLAHPKQKNQVLPFLTERTEMTWVTSSIVVYEFFRPSIRRQKVHEVQAWLGSVLDGIEDFDKSAALEAAEIEASLAGQEKSLRMRDLLIGSHARDIGATFVTFDKRDFENDSVQQLVDVEVLTA